MAFWKADLKNNCRILSALHWVEERCWGILDRTLFAFGAALWKDPGKETCGLGRTYICIISAGIRNSLDGQLLKTRENEAADWPAGWLGHCLHCQCTQKWLWGKWDLLVTWFFFSHMGGICTWIPYSWRRERKQFNVFARIIADAILLAVKSEGFGDIPIRMLTMDNTGALGPIRRS